MNLIITSQSKRPYRIVHAIQVGHEIYGTLSSTYEHSGDSVKNSNSIIWDKFRWKRDQKLLYASKKLLEEILEFQLVIFVCMCLYVQLRIFHSHGEVSIIGEGF